MKIQNWKSSPAVALTALVGVTAIWGSTFIIVQDATSRMPVMDFLAVRFVIASLVMLALRPTCLRGMSRLEILRGAGLGIMLGMAYITQTFGLQYSSASVIGFITGMSVVLTPLVSFILLRRNLNVNTWIAVALATVGLALLSLHGWSIGVGELLTLECAMFLAIHIVGLGEWSPRHEIYGFSFVQVATVAVITLGVTVPQGIVMPPDGGVWLAIGITAVLATAAAFFIQTWTQTIVSSTRTAVVLTMEPVFGGLFAVILGGDQLTLRTISGAACVLAAMLIVQLKSAKDQPVREAKMASGK